VVFLLDLANEAANGQGVKDLPDSLWVILGEDVLGPPHPFRFYGVWSIKSGAIGILRLGLG
jgi:hypothetical protein